MAPEQAFAPKRDPLAAPESFENEIPTYRAISALALASAASGLLSGLSFVSFWWLVLSVLAVILGVFGAWRIRSMPDLLTGRSYAHAGIAMGLIFGVSSLCYETYSMYSLRAQSRAFAAIVVKTMNVAKQKTPPDAVEVLWWMMPPDIRKGKVPEDARAEIAQMAKSSAKVQQVEEQLRWMAAYAGKEEPIAILDLENAFYSERDAYATVLLRVGDGHDHREAEVAKAGPKGKNVKQEIIGEHPDHALLVVHGQMSRTGYNWYVDEIQYPYEPKTFTATPKKPVVDDGHGHAH